jgi:hypothetical protein
MIGRNGDGDMKSKRRMSRYALARRLQSGALQISAGKPIRIGSTSVRIPANAVIEEEIDTTRGGTEIEFEIRWPSSASQSGSSKPLHTTAQRSTTGSQQ